MKRTLFAILLVAVKMPLFASASTGAATHTRQIVALDNPLLVVPHVEVVMGATFTNHIVTGALLSNSLPVAPRLVASANEKQMFWIEAFDAQGKPMKVLTTRMVEVFQHTPQGKRRLTFNNGGNWCLLSKQALVGRPPWTITVTLKPAASPWGWPKETPKADLQPRTWIFDYKTDWINNKW